MANQLTVNVNLVSPDQSEYDAVKAYVQNWVQGETAPWQIAYDDGAMTITGTLAVPFTPPA